MDGGVLSLEVEDSRSRVNEEKVRRDPEGDVPWREGEGTGGIGGVEYVEGIELRVDIRGGLRR